MTRYRASGPVQPLPSAFVEELIDHWRAHGRKALDRVCRWTPHRYLQLVAALTPPGMSETDRLAALSDEALMKEYHDVMASESAAGRLPPFLRYVPLGDD